jgi:hypothetical protein
VQRLYTENQLAFKALSDDVFQSSESPPFVQEVNRIKLGD